MFLIDKCRPNKIEDFLFNKEILEKLMFISSNEDIPHIIFTGPDCSGKETLVKFLLGILFDSDVNKVDRVKYQIVCPSSKKEVFVNQSNYHISFEPTNTNHDKYILQGIISQYATTGSFKIFKTNRNFKILIIHNAENLASNCQYILRRNMELYASNLRIFILCNDLSKMIDPLRSRCQIFCFSSPTKYDIHNVLTNISLKENIDMNTNDYQYILQNCNNNLTKAIWMLDCKRLGSEDKPNLDIIYDVLINIIFTSCDTEKFGEIFDLKIRTNIYNILITNIKGSEIILTLMEKIIDKIDDEETICKIVQHASFTEYNLIHGRRDIKHIDYFIIQVIRELYNKKLIGVKPVQSNRTKRNIPSKTSKTRPKKISSGSKTVLKNPTNRSPNKKSCSKTSKPKSKISRT